MENPNKLLLKAGLALGALGQGWDLSFRSWASDRGWERFRDTLGCSGAVFCPMPPRAPRVTCKSTTAFQVGCKIVAGILDEVGGVTLV